MEIAKIVLSYMQVLLNWPFLGACIIFIFINMFKARIDDFLGRLVRGKIGAFSLESSPKNQEKSIEIVKEQEPNKKLLKSTNGETTISYTEYSRIYKLYIFERAFGVIFGTQIRLLKYLNSIAGKGEKLSNLIIYYSEYLKKNITTKRSTFHEYIEFLEAFGFIQITTTEEYDRIAKITQRGVEFFNYIKSEYSALYEYKDL